MADRSYDNGGVLDGLGFVDKRPEQIAEAVIQRLRTEGYDAFRKGSYHDISGRVWQVIVEELRKLDSD